MKLMSAPFPLDEQLCFALYSASMAIGRAYKPMLDKLGLTYPQYLVLHALWEQDGRTIGEIAERLGLESSTITPLVKRMEAASPALLTRTRNPADERQVQVRLTDRGREIREECGCLGEELLARSGMTVEQLGKLNRKVQGLRDAVKEEL
jgi:MarR family transcriptional regulator, organic hydroperoxide resistance regulator